MPPGTNLTSAWYHVLQTSFIVLAATYDDTEARNITVTNVVRRE
eukprot:CAMPEP_0118639986 /NCGR_PEP_ID=MMETSP0785-20121206/4515_1 /TAXON_ID=91992 /ORGANISM="Bolidomonas pacifica, Strain CCMP 1866" /LENGTH=43 /DNA_ID= /DNA_START= /DNA_END= /DNA_ORIENTATION=